MTDAADIEGGDLLAAELALRVLDREAETAARARQAADPAFAADVAAWEARLAVLFDDVAPVQPSTHVWSRIEARLAAPANDNRKLAFWRRWAVASTGLLAASVAALAVMVARPNPVVPPPAAPPAAAATAPTPEIARIATLSTPEGEAFATVVYDSATETLYLAPLRSAQQDARVPHLWLMLPDGGVQLVGAIDGRQPSRQLIAPGLSAQIGQVAQLAISMEAPGHAPAPNKPDGPVVASGDIRTL